MIYTSILENEYLGFYKKIEGEKSVEIRLDRAELSDSEINSLFSTKGLTTIATCRKDIHSDRKRESILKKAIDSGADFIDIEIESDRSYYSRVISYAKEKNCGIIISYHNYNYTPNKNELKILLNRISMVEGAIAKIACKVNNIIDLKTILELYSITKDNKIIAIGMGNLGRVTRVIADKRGAKITFAAKDKNSKMTGCQFTRDELKQLLKEY